MVAKIDFLKITPVIGLSMLTGSNYVEFFLAFCHIFLRNVLSFHQQFIYFCTLIFTVSTYTEKRVMETEMGQNEIDKSGT